MPKITVHGGPSNANDDHPAAEEDQTEAAQPATEDKADTADETSAPDYEALNVGQLREEASRRGLDHTGKKAELVERLEASDQPATNAHAGAAEGSGGAS